MVTTTPLEAELLELAGSVPDPELPVLTLRELGVVRAVHARGADAVEVELTPTYTGCPAVEAMSHDIERVLREHGVREVTVRRVLAPAWSTDDITDEGRRKLREFGIAPPRVRADAGPVAVSLGPTRTRHSPGEADLAPVRCPHCGSAETELLSRFSSTACKALRRCLSCREPFDHFKEL
ncbi:1,2-phenylacetyl-CoA epoxidase subunit PaaD [Streptomyces fungicidicus]|jgi:ring-1,2-phenylacetyl-CoA epoxidase subunit PaaD|uniref:Phenylacetate-CoA oxygenase subunit PaaJ n=1 Tax=Streptomyces fungicidicus TaxID=68203 RepID=A0A494V2D2_9ACTN|nr:MULTISPECIES: 1,2-phenylacetyl-CoA epoxidase subunit PaaD [Streptomyces]AYL37091.1 phenylacetate-CoA oxygenase subunit PaaJ [Streptomyces fungicidicus]QKW01493.1 phenylacetate-CoA oxygenase subunit PaaJ [Streptomyces sp. NA02536]TQL21410.1 ring-1,2-phenylacetyl-CoA epoxidase subunit PaaD [Streptomyces sp. SLBN-134]